VVFYIISTAYGGSDFSRDYIFYKTNYFPGIKSGGWRISSYDFIVQVPGKVARNPSAIQLTYSSELMKLLFYFVKYLMGIHSSLCGYFMYNTGDG